jgi:hypothetical protein
VLPIYAHEDPYMILLLGWQNILTLSLMRL